MITIRWNSSPHHHYPTSSHHHHPHPPLLTKLLTSSPHRHHPHLLLTTTHILSTTTTHILTPTSSPHHHILSSPPHPLLTTYIHTVVVTHGLRIVTTLKIRMARARITAILTMVFNAITSALLRYTYWGIRLSWGGDPPVKWGWSPDNHYFHCTINKVSSQFPHFTFPNNWSCILPCKSVSRNVVNGDYFQVQAMNIITSYKVWCSINSFSGMTAKYPHMWLMFETKHTCMLCSVFLNKYFLQSQCTTTTHCIDRGHYFLFVNHLCQRQPFPVGIKIHIMLRL